VARFDATGAMHAGKHAVRDAMWRSMPRNSLCHVAVHAQQPRYVMSDGTALRRHGHHRERPGRMQPWYIAIAHHMPLRQSGWQSVSRRSDTPHQLLDACHVERIYLGHVLSMC
jgi:hypothetical protein